MDAPTPARKLGDRAGVGRRYDAPRYVHSDADLDAEHGQAIERIKENARRPSAACDALPSGDESEWWKPVRRRSFNYCWASMSNLDESTKYVAV